MRRFALTSTLFVASLVATASLPACEPTDPEDGTPTTQSPDTTDTTSGPDEDASAPTGPITITGFNAVEIAAGGETTPLTLDGIPPYSHGTTDLNFYNTTAGALTIESVTLEVVAPAEAHEFALTVSGRTERLPVQTTDIALAPNEGVSYGVHFIPLASGPRDVRVRVRHTAGEDVVVTVHARGRDSATFSPNVATALERLVARDNVAHSNGLELGGLDADAQGNLYFSGNGSEWGDAYNDNLVFGKLTATGDLAWVYEWNEKWTQKQADVGNNSDTGGPSDALDVDAAGNVYATGYRVPCVTTVGSAETAFVLSLDTHGALRWARSLSNGSDAESPALVREYLRGYAVDATLDDRVIVAGRVPATGGFLLVALSKADGTTLWAHDIAFGGGESRVGALVVDRASGQAYIGGIQGSVPFMARVDDVDTAAPSLAWARNFGWNATSVHGAVLDGNGLVLAFENRGLQTQFLAARVNAADGAVVWSKVWDATNAGDSNAALTIALHEGTAVIGGRIAITPFDTQGGDGFLLGLDPASGAYRWAAFHYGGKGAEEMAHDYIVALVSTPAGLWAMHQQTPGSNNHHHFWGRWYQAIDFGLEFPGGDGVERLVDADLQGEDVTDATELYELTDVGNLDTLASECADGAWVDWTARMNADAPLDAEAASFQAGTHGLLQKLTISD